MKLILAAGMLSLPAFQAAAGSITYEAPNSIVLAEPSMGMGSGSWIIPLVILSVIALAISQKSSVTG